MKNRIILKIITTAIIATITWITTNWVGGIILGKESAIFIILKLIGWQVENGIITKTTPIGLVTVVIIIGIASITTELVCMENSISD